MSEFVITPRRVGRFLAAVVAFLLVANLICVYLKYILGLSHGFIGTFLFGKEFNIPSLYSSLALFAAGLLLFAISRLGSEKEARRYLYWKFIGAVFIFLSVDELFALHEMLTAPSRAVIGHEAGGFLHYAWVVPYAIVFAFAGLLMFRFFLQLSASTKIRFSIAAFVFLGGAVGLEVIGGFYDFHYVPGESDLALALLVSAEETFEMAGVVIFTHALLQYYSARLHENDRSVRLVFQPGEQGLLARSKTSARGMEQNIA